MPGPWIRAKFLEAQRAFSQDATRPSDRVAIGSVLLGAIVVGVILVQLGSDRPVLPQIFGSATTSQAARVQSGHVPTPADSVAPTVEAVAQQAQTHAVPGAGSLRRQVGHTDGEGVVLRASRRDDDWTPRGFMDGEWVTVLDQPDPNWALVQGDNGEQGWIPVRYLAAP